MKKIIRLTESDLARIVRRVINEQQEKPILGKWTSTLPDDKEHGQGFYHIRINSDDNITSIINKWDGGQQESDKKELADDEPKENNTIGATFWFKRATPNQKTLTINITGTSGSLKLNCNIKDELLNGYAFYFTNLSIGTYTITTSNSSTDSLTVVVS